VGVRSIGVVAVAVEEACVASTGPAFCSYCRWYLSVVVAMPSVTFQAFLVRRVIVNAATLAVFPSLVVETCQV